MATNLWSSIVDAWAANETLNALLPSSKVSIGRTEDDIKTADLVKENGLPYCTVFTSDDNPTERSSRAIYSQERVQFSVFAEGHANARAIQVAIRELFDDPSLELTLDDGRAISFLRQSGGRVVADAGCYHAFDVYVLTKSK